LRDDLKSRITTLTDYYHTKYRLLTTLSNNETELLYSLKAGNSEKVDVLLDDDQDTIEKINMIDLQMQNETDAFVRMAGITSGSFETYIGTLDDECVNEVLVLKKSIRDLLDEIYEKREEANRLMAVELKKTAEDIEGLMLMRKIRFTRQD